MGATDETEVVMSGYIGPSLWDMFKYFILFGWLIDILKKGSK